MKQFGVFIRKEFLHVFRDRKTLLMLFGLPIAQILLFGFALTNEIKDTRIAVLDMAEDNLSEQLVHKIEVSKYFDIEKNLRSNHEILGAFKEGKIRMALIIPDNFSHDLQHLNKATVQILADASDPNAATNITSYLSNIILDKQLEMMQNQKIPLRIQPQIKMLYNPQLKGAPNFVPGVMALVLMLVCVMMTSVSIAREKENGTMEVLLVSPFHAIFVIISKAIPYLVLSIINLTVILTLSVYVLDLPVNGSLWLLVAESVMFIITTLSLGILISIASASQQSAMLLSLLGMMLPTMLFTGFMFPIENMPVPLQIISNIIPAKYYFIIVKSIMIKGLGFHAIWKETAILFGMTVFFLAVSLRKFKIRLA
jgi:ABC-2 type transport system permease protein